MKKKQKVTAKVLEDAIKKFDIVIDLQRSRIMNFIDKQLLEVKARWIEGAYRAETVGELEEVSIDFSIAPILKIDGEKVSL